jgi:hypothetical protein
LYFGVLKNCELSAVVLPAGERFEVTERVSEQLETDVPSQYLYELKICIVKAGLQRELAKKLSCALYKTNFVTSEKLIISNFFENSFVVLDKSSKENIVNELHKLDAKKLVIRGKISPEHQKNLKETLEKQLRGTKKLHMFLEGDRYLICELLR